MLELKRNSLLDCMSYPELIGTPDNNMKGRVVWLLRIIEIMSDLYVTIVNKFLY